MTNNFTTFIINNIEYYMMDVDVDYNNTYDVLYDKVNDNIGDIEKQDMGYFIDINSDGKWDYILGDDGELNPYENKDVGLPGFGFFMIILIGIILIIKFKIKKTC